MTIALILFFHIPFTRLQNVSKSERSQAVLGNITRKRVRGSTPRKSAGSRRPFGIPLGYSFLKPYYGLGHADSNLGFYLGRIVGELGRSKCLRWWCVVVLGGHVRRPCCILGAVVSYRFPCGHDLGMFLCLGVDQMSPQGQGYLTVLNL